MQWEKADVEKTEPMFEFKLAPNKSSMQPGVEKGMSKPKLGPIAISYDQNMGWVTEKMGPNSKHWKRLAREIKSNAPTKNTSPTKLKSEGPTPLIKLDPNALELKRKRGKNKLQVDLEHENPMVGGVAVAAR
nr:hypothetical protein CFP56_70454 [Quercus suber]